MEKYTSWYNKRKGHRTEQIPLTVCVAAISKGIIFGASDRMITAGDIQFEPQQPKLYPLTNSIVAQVAGDASIQSQLMQRVAAEVNRQIKAAPKVWLNVRDIAELYCHYYEELRLTHSEHDILAPLALDRHTWISRQKEMDSELIIKIANALMDYEWEKTAVIFSGVDSFGAHIYVVRDGVSSCQDSVGFAAIGAGEWHANSQLMFAGHTKDKPIPETLLLVYSAKKRAEVAPGVGKGTDMFAIGPGLGTLEPIVDEIVDGLGKIYSKEQKRHDEAAIKARTEADKYVKEIAKRAIEKAQETKPPNIEGETSLNTN